MPAEKGTWFEFDINVRDVRKKLEWFNRLSPVAETLVVQWIRICCGFAQPGGSTVERSHNTCHVLLIHVSTSGVGDSYPPFHMVECPLEEWVQLGADCRG